MHHVTNSERTTWTACQFLWLMSYAFRLTPKTKAKPLRMGTMWHGLMERLSNGETVEALIGELMTQGRLFDPSQASDTGMRLDVAGMLDRYDRRHHIQRLTSVACEVELAAKINARVGYAGKLDKIGRMHGESWLKEHKTSSSPLKDWLANNRHSQQTVGYAWLARKSGVEVVGVIYDLALTKPPSKIATRKDGSPRKPAKGKLPHVEAATWRKACQGHKPEDWHEDVLVRLIERELDGYWCREEVVRFTDEDFERFEEEITRVACRIAAAHDAVYHLQKLPIHEALRHKSASARTRNLGACMRWGRACEFKALCQRRTQEEVERFDIRETIHAELESV